MSSREVTSNLVKGKGEVEVDDDFWHASDGDSDSLTDDSDSSVNHGEGLKKFMAVMNGLNKDQVNETGRLWFCPACKGRPGGTRRYKGLRALFDHATNQRSVRVRLHKDFSRLLEDAQGPFSAEHGRGTAGVPAAKTFGHLHSLDEGLEKEIVWPPMVVVMNTNHGRDENGKWIGMGNKELLDCFPNYHASKARHSYGPMGHRGMSLLIFEPSAWEQRPVPFCPGGKMELYGYMAQKKDLDSFNQHCAAKNRIRFDICSYQEKVVQQLKRLGQGNQKLLGVKGEVAEGKSHSAAAEESMSAPGDLLKQNAEECFRDYEEDGSGHQAKLHPRVREEDLANFAVNGGHMEEERPMKKQRLPLDSES